MPTTMLFTMMLCFGLSISVAVAIGLASLVGAAQANLNFLAIVKEMFSRDQQVSACGHPLLHPRRQPDGVRRNLGAPGRVRQVDRRRHPGRTRRHVRAYVHDFRRGVGIECGDDVRDRRDPHPRAHQARLSDELRGRAAGGVCRAGRHHPAVDSDDPLRRLGRGLDRRDVHFRLRPGPPDRPRADGFRHHPGAHQGLRQERP